MAVVSSAGVNEDSQNGSIGSSNGFTFAWKRADGIEVRWIYHMLPGKRLFVEVPPIEVVDGSKESFIALLEHAEEELGVEELYVGIEKTRSDRVVLARAFSFFGFQVLGPDRVPPLCSIGLRRRRGRVDDGTHCSAEGKGDQEVSGLAEAAIPLLEGHDGDDADRGGVFGNGKGAGVFSTENFMFMVYHM
jgi:hypothetical protein